MSNKDVDIENYQGYKKFIFRKDYVYDKGWDKFAEDYAQMLIPGTIYYLTKEIFHQIISDFLPKNVSLSVLDLNCGTGNDFPFFLKNGWKIYGCDGSAGMLNKAHERYSDEISKGKIKLFLGKLENLDPNSFENKKFDLIFSVTGGYSYIDDVAFKRANDILSHFLSEKGFMITAHLNKFCLADSLYNLLKLRFQKAFQRLNENLVVNIKNESYRMYLRNKKELKKLTPAGLRMTRIIPLLSFTPPYQTGYRPPLFLYKLHRMLEHLFLKAKFLSPIADQIVTVYCKDKNSIIEGVL